MNGTFVPMIGTALDWSRVQAFLAVAETGSLSGAARQLGQSQPTLGRHIHLLETQLGVALFKRQPRGMTLTEAGAALIDAADAMRRAAHQLSLVAAGEAEAATGTVRLTASVVISHYILPPVLAELRAAAPEIDVDLVASDTTENLLFRDADIALRMYRPTQLDMVTRHLGDMPLAIFAAKSYLARRGAPVSGLDLLAHDMIGYDTNDLIVTEMRRLGLQVQREDFALRCDHQSAAWELLRAGCGIGFGPQVVGRADPRLTELDLGVTLPSLPVWLTMPEKLRAVPRVRRVWDHVAAQVGGLLDAADRRS